MTFSPRPYQLAAIEAMARPCAKGRLVVMGVGTGKTLTTLARVVQVLDAGGRVVWLAHRQELLTQPLNDLRKNWFKHAMRAGIVQADRDAVDAQCVFASIATLARPARLQALLAHGPIALVVVDEAHHEPSAQYRRVLEGLVGPDTELVGLTATPDREDGKPLEGRWDIVYSYDLLDGIRDGWLVEPYVSRYYMPELEAEIGPDGRLDFDTDVEEAVLLRNHVVHHTVAALTTPVRAERLPWRDDARDFDPRARRWLVFTATVHQATLTAQALCKAGIRARSISGDPRHTKPSDRELILRAYRQGEIQVLCNADLLTEGTDLPMTDGVLVARACRSRPLFVQILGRGARLHDKAWDHKHWGLANRFDRRYTGKGDCLVIDLTGCTDEHSIVAAPVLIGEACDHRWEPAPEGGARCPDCKQTRPCWASLEAGRDGMHLWPSPRRGAADEPSIVHERPACRFCGREQCRMAPEGKHVWRNLPDHKRGCVYCPAEYTDPLACMIRKRPGATETEDMRFVDGDEVGSGDVALVRLDVHPETWAVDLDVHGLLLLTGAREGIGSWSIRWHRPAADPRPLGQGLDTRRAWATARDMIRQTAKRRQDAYLQREVFGGQPSDEAREQLRRRATEVARVGT